MRYRPWAEPLILARLEAALRWCRGDLRKAAADFNGAAGPGMPYSTARLYRARYPHLRELARRLQAG